MSDDDPRKETPSDDELESVLRDQIRVYRPSVVEHGDSPRATFNTRREIQHLRFERLMRPLLAARESFSIHDVGAGGLGLVFFRQLNTFNEGGVTAVILAILLLILFGELVSYFVRKAII